MLSNSRQKLAETKRVTIKYFLAFRYFLFKLLENLAKIRTDKVSKNKIYRIVFNSNYLLINRKDRRQMLRFI